VSQSAAITAFGSPNKMAKAADARLALCTHQNLFQSRDDSISPRKFSKPPNIQQQCRFEAPQEAVVQAQTLAEVEAEEDLEAGEVVS
jgi:hypothetical protein